MPGQHGVAPAQRPVDAVIDVVVEAGRRRSGDGHSLDALADQGLSSSAGTLLEHLF